MWHEVQRGQHLHVLLHLLRSLLMDEICQSSGDIQVLRTILWALPPFSGECWDQAVTNTSQRGRHIYILSGVEGYWLPLRKGWWEGDLFPFIRFVRQSVHYLPWGRGFWALGLMKILGRNGVLELSIFSRNLSWGRMMFFAWSSRKVSDFVFLLYSPAYDQWIQYFITQQLNELEE